MITSSPNWSARLAMIFAILTLWTSAAKAADYYAAIAYSKSTQRFGYTFGKTSLAAAQRAAYSYDKSPDAEVVIYSRNAWCALARSNSGNGWGCRLGHDQTGLHATRVGQLPWR